MRRSAFGHIIERVIRQIELEQCELIRPKFQPRPCCVERPAGLRGLKSCNVHLLNDALQSQRRMAFRTRQNFRPKKCLFTAVNRWHFPVRRKQIPAYLLENIVFVTFLKIFLMTTIYGVRMTAVPQLVGEFSFLRKPAFLRKLPVFFSFDPVQSHLNHVGPMSD